MKPRTSFRSDGFFTLSISVLAAVALSSGCITKPGTHDPGYVAKNWSMMMREFGIVPVFPPREDIQVGDVYAMPVPPDAETQMRAVRNRSGQFLPIPVLLASVDVRAELEAHYKKRYSFPATPTTLPTTRPNVFPQPAVDAGQSVFATGDAPTRLRLGGFPEFFSTQISQGGVSGMVPTEALNVAFGALGSANKRVRVSIPMVESYGVPVGGILAKVSQDGSTIRFGSDTRSDGAAGFSTISAAQLEQLVKPAGGFDKRMQALVDEAKARDGNAKGYLVLITEVYATRSIDVSVEAESAGGGGVNLRPTTELLRKLPGFSATQPSTRPATPTTQPEVKAAEFEVATPAQIAAAMTNQLNQQLAASAPGVNVKFISVTAFGVSMRRTYERPIVIGYRGIVYKLGQDSQVAIAGTASAIVPVSKKLSESRAKMQKELEAAIQAQLGARTQVRLTFVGDAAGELRRVKAVVSLNPSAEQLDAMGKVVQNELRRMLDKPSLPVDVQATSAGDEPGEE